MIAIPSPKTCAAVLCLGVSVLLLAVTQGGAADAKAAFETKAPQVIVIDGETGAILFSREPDQRFAPASLAKLMTMEIVFEAIEAKTLDPVQEFPVSEYAWRTGGAPSGTSTMFAKLKSSVPLDALVHGTIIQAANDAAIVIAEGMAGSEAGFAAMMNKQADKLGLSGSHFVNPTGLPAEGQYVTARDLAALARHIEEHHPDFYRLYSQPSFEWNKIFQRNRNPLLDMNIGATGMGTGYAQDSGYSIVGVTEREGRKTFAVMGGLASAKERAEEAKKLLDWAHDAFRREQLFAAGATVGTANVYGGVAADVPLVTREAVVAFVPTDRAESVSAHIVYDGPLQAPIEKGARIGSIEVRIDGRPSVTRDVFAGAAVEQGTFAARALDAAQELAFGWIRAL